MLKALEMRFLWSLWWRPWWNSCAPAAHRGDPCQRSWIPKGGSEPMRSPCWRRLLSGTWRPAERGAHTGRSPVNFLARHVTLWRTHPGSDCAWKTASCGKVNYAGSLGRAAGHGMDSHWKSVGRTVCHGRSTILEQGEGTASWAVAGAMCNVHTAFPLQLL